MVGSNDVMFKQLELLEKALGESNKKQEAKYSIGDIVSEIQGKEGEWLLCDGAVVDSSKYYGLFCIFSVLPLIANNNGSFYYVKAK